MGLEHLLRAFSCALAVSSVGFLPLVSSCGKSGDKPQTQQALDTSDPDVMRQFFPLEVGNSWTYKRTVKDSEVFFYTEGYTTKSSWGGIPKGIGFFTTGIGNAMQEMPEVSHETYKITGRDQGVFFSVEVTGDNPRDGRYRESVMYGHSDINLRWGYVGEGVWEKMSGSYTDAPSENTIWTAVLKPDISLNPGNDENEQCPRWTVASTMSTDAITVPAGVFKNVLVNVTMVNGCNAYETLLGKPPQYTQDGFHFRVEEYFARGVGLVKEIQFDQDENITYMLELEDYTVR